VLPELPSSAVRRALAVELRRLREHAGMPGDDVAARLGWSGSKVSRIETHRTGVKMDDLELLLDLYAVDDTQRSQLRALGEEQEARGWWTPYASSFSPTYIAYIGLEAAAESIHCWSPELIHGLLQTEDYARAATSTAFGSPSPVSPGEIQRLIDVRLRRQEMLSQPGQRQFVFILDEATLRHRFGNPQLMRAQLSQVEELSHLPRITIRVLPFSGSYPIGPGGFALLQFAPVHGTSLSDVVYMEHLTGNSFVEAEAETYEYKLAFDRLMAKALDEDASRKLLMKIAKDIWSDRMA
jgi:transcriptional regulator with XRE-family HTH domain